MFNSQKINTDPTPLYKVYMVARNGRTAEWEMRAASEDMAIEAAMNMYPNHDVHTVGAFYNRPEFDNNPNPILVEFRKSWADYREHHEHDIALAAERFIASDCDEPTARDYHSPDQIDHARNVLERLIALDTVRDWCSKCNKVTFWSDEVCDGCGREWGSHE